MRGPRTEWRRKLRDCDCDFRLKFPFERNTMGMRKLLHERMDVEQKSYRTSTNCTKISRDLYFLRREWSGYPLCQVG
jgi:hypothetical protein